MRNHFLFFLVVSHALSLDYSRKNSYHPLPFLIRYSNVSKKNCFVEIFGILSKDCPRPPSSGSYLGWFASELNNFYLFWLFPPLETDDSTKNSFLETVEYDPTPNGDPMLCWSIWGFVVLSYLEPALYVGSSSDPLFTWKLLSLLRKLV